MAVQHYAEVVDMNQSILAKIQASPAGHAYTLDAIHDVAHGLLALVDCYIQLGEFNLAKERFQAFSTLHKKLLACVYVQCVCVCACVHATFGMSRRQHCARMSRLNVWLQRTH
jgi:hypothetical protein